ncbi:hypothetical protein C6A87_016805 [Mycobacterium sp. ITM-2016-00317]|uniref:hypothetical protein n=1 Tax=Mycobacterium sp. ITM-2016-00317 TaxID=2099694 RepID=UPI000D3FC8FF|nr:hypothetical protein [Mycobacterium sp. ITM-2016-00317]WNG85604.1 hypothetical protein C6A87_016805 [Mycobacterium sp. ITM-2016-00317]
MLIAALVLAVIGLAALVMAVVTSNELIAWVCIAASAIGVILLIVDALRERSNRNSDDESDSAATDSDDPESAGSEYEHYPDEAPIAEDYDGTLDEPPAGSAAEDPAAVDVEPETRSDGETPKN